MTGRSHLILWLLIAAALLAFAVLVALQPASPRGDADTASSHATLVLAFSESAVERRQRLMPSLSSQLTQMIAPAFEPRVEQMLLRQTRHSGHVGLYTDRPEGFTPTSIVLHATGSGAPGSEFASLEALGLFFQRQGVAASHYGVDRDGRIMQYVDDRQAAFHVSRRGWNGISLGIELINDNTGSQPFPPAQVRATRKLVQMLGDRYGIPVEAVVAHKVIQPEDRSDPAANFPWDSFVSSLRPPGSSDVEVRTGRSDAGRERLDAGRSRGAGDERHTG